MWWWALYAALAALVAVVVLIPYRPTNARYRRLVARIPGPPTIPFVGSVLLLLSTTRAGLIPLLQRLHKQYGSIFRIHLLGLTHVMVSDVNEIEKLLSSMSYITKSYDYNLLTPWLGDGLLVSTGAKWHSRRKLLTPAFHFRILDEYVPVFNRCASTLVRKMAERVDDASVPVNDLVTLCTLDIICETAMGTRIDAQDGKGQEYVQAVLRISELFQTRQLSPWLWRDWLFRLSATGREQKRVLETLHGFTTRVILERQEELRASRRAPATADADAAHEGDGEGEGAGADGPKKKKRRLLALLDLLLQVAEDDPGSLALDDIREEVDTFMFEGHDTTSAALSWCIFLLAHNPEAQELAAAEQVEVLGASQEEPTLDELGRMRYLEQVIKEALRLYPSVPVIGRLLERDAQVGGMTVPEGAFLTFSPLLLHRDPALYPDPLAFRPERFSPEASAARHPFAYIPFSAGPRGCIGQRFALLEEKAVLSALLRTLRFEPTTCPGDGPDDVTPLMELVLRPERPLRVRVRRRGDAGAPGGAR